VDINAGWSSVVWKKGIIDGGMYQGLVIGEADAHGMCGASPLEQKTTAKKPLTLVR
jgi:hypothetical protein